MELSDEQISQIVNDILPDVHHYVIEHEKEYQEFLKQESDDDSTLTNSSSQKGVLSYEIDIEKN